MGINGYELSRVWFNFCFDNPEKVKPIHTAIYFFAIEHCNRLGWKEKFGFPSQMVMEAIGVKNWRTYSSGLKDLVDFGFINMIETSKNQYSSNIIAIVKNTKAPTKALDKALSKHSTKQGQSTVSIDKQDNNITIEQRTIFIKEILKNENQKISTIKSLKAVGLIVQDYDSEVEKFVLKLIADDDVYKNATEIKKHFNNWLRLEIKNKDDNKVESADNSRNEMLKYLKK